MNFHIEGIADLRLQSWMGRQYKGHYSLWLVYMKKKTESKYILQGSLYIGYYYYKLHKEPGMSEHM